jgi:hypothetical protein
MIHIKNVKSLSCNEVDELNNIINIYYDYNDLFNNDIIVYEKNELNQIIAYTGLIIKKYDNISLINQLCIINSKQNIINKVKKITKKILLICLPSSHEFIEYLINNDFKIYNEENNNIIMTYTK